MSSKHDSEIKWKIESSLLVFLLLFLSELSRKLMNLIDDRDSMALLSKKSDSKPFLQSLTHQGAFCQEWIISSGDHCCLSMAVHLDGCHYSPALFEVQTEDQCIKCEFLTALTLLSSPHSTAPQDIQVVIMMEKKSTIPRIFLHPLVQTFTHSWIGHCDIHPHWVNII